VLSSFKGYFCCLVYFLLFTSICDARVVAIEGNTGAGKTTLINLLANEMKAIVVSEPFEKWRDVNGAGDLFAEYIRDPKTWSLHLAIYSAATKIEALKSALRSELLLIDRSIFADRHAFAEKMLRSGELSQTHFSAYQDMLACMLKEKPFLEAFIIPYDRQLPLHREIYTKAFSYIETPFSYKIDGIIYLRTSPEICSKRAAKRNRDAKDPDAGPNGSFYQQLGQAHDEWLYDKATVKVAGNDVRVLTVNGDVDFERDDDAKTKTLISVKEFINSLPK